MANAIVAFQGWDASGVSWGDQGWGEGKSACVATAAIGTTTVAIGAVVNVTGVQVVGSIGTITISQSVIVYPTGVVGYGQIGTALVWGLVNDTQTPSWVIIPDTQTPTWGAISTPQTPNWQRIAA